ncbi:MAG: hypothetical protein KL787_02915, partial [Taibaiella sp.]|nr:hypothetical protein [Taibaiella sp.]
YYQFKGDISANYFESPVVVQLQSQDGQQGNLTGNYRFVRSGADWKLFNTDEKKVTSYYLDKNTEAALFYYKTPEPTEEEQAQRAEEINNAYHQSNTQLQPQAAEQNRPGLPERE